MEIRTQQEYFVAFENLDRVRVVECDFVEWCAVGRECFGERAHVNFALVESQ